MSDDYKFNWPSQPVKENRFWPRFQVAVNSFMCDKTPDFSRFRCADFRTHLVSVSATQTHDLTKTGNNFRADTGTIYLPRWLGQHLADAEELTVPRTWNSNSADSQARQNRHLKHDFAINAQIAHVWHSTWNLAQKHEFNAAQQSHLRTLLRKMRKLRTLLKQTLRTMCALI